MLQPHPEGCGFRICISDIIKLRKEIKRKYGGRKLAKSILIKKNKRRFKRNLK